MEADRYRIPEMLREMKCEHSNSQAKWTGKKTVCRAQCVLEGWLCLRPLPSVFDNRALVG